MKLYKLIFAIIFLGISLNSYSQKKNILIVDNKTHFGQIINNFVNYDSFPARKLSISNEFYIGYKTCGNRKWHNYYRFPEIGISYIFSEFGNKKQLGHAHGIVPSITLKLLGNNKHELNLRIGAGLGYFNNPFDSINNPYNILIGRKIMNYSFFSFIFQQKLNKKLYLTIAWSLLHGSDGHYQIPNGSVNIPTGDIGFKYYIRENKDLNKLPIPKIKDRLRINLTFGIGMHEFGGTLKPVGTPKHKIYASSLYLSKRYKISNLHIGVSAKYYNSFYNFIQNDSILNDKIKLNSSVFTLFIGDEAIIGQVGIFFQIGYNFHRPALTKMYKKKANNFSNLMGECISEKLGIRLFAFNPDKKITFNPYIGIALKTKRFGTADYPELSCGMVF